MEFVKPNTKIPFMAYKNKFLFVSAILMVVSIILIFTIGPNYSIDFRGGMELQYRFAQSVSVGDIRQALDTEGYSRAIVQEIESPGFHDYLIAFDVADDDLSDKTELITGVLDTSFPDNPIDLRSVDSVGPRVGANLKRAAILSVIYALLLILAYIWFRFDVAFSPGAVVSLIHDVTITMGILVLLRVDFGLTIIAALLTLVGYSLNDTIVVFDRIRDNLTQFGKLAFEKIIDRSLNEILSRSVLTSLTTLIVVLMLMFFGGPTLYPFALTFAIGIIIGTYSSIYIASPVALFVDKWLTERRNQGPKKR